MALHTHTRRSTSRVAVAPASAVLRSCLAQRLGNRGMLQLARAKQEIDRCLASDRVNGRHGKPAIPLGKPAATGAVTARSATAPNGDIVARREQLPRESEAITERETCTPAPGLTPSTCAAYSANAWWLPRAYVNNATCACQETPNEPTANCVRKFLQDRLVATPGWVKRLAASQKPNDSPASPTYPAYQAFVQAMLTPRIYTDHVDAYALCCCPSGPAPYPAWIGVTTVPMPCSAVGWSIRQFGSCHGTPGRW